MPTFKLFLVTLLISACAQHTPSATRDASEFSSTGYNLDNYSVDPKNQDRNFTCPVAFASSQTQRFGINATYIPFKSNSERESSWAALNSVTDPIVSPSELKLTFIDIRRVNGIPHYHYFSNNTQGTPVQPWSSSKMFAFAMAADSLREQSQGRFGLDSFTDDVLCGGKKVHIGELITLATTYIHPDGCAYTSENISTWAQNISGRLHSHSIIRKWLGRPEPEDLSGGYGNNSSALGSEIESRAGQKFSVTLDASHAGRNYLSTYSMAEFLKRMVMHREDAASRLPNAQWEDMKVIFYGGKQEDAKFLPTWKVGGMLGGPSTYIHSALGPMDEVVPHSFVFRSRFLAKYAHENWRTYTKIGWGPAITDANGNYTDNDFVWNGYACIPVYDEAGNLTNKGREFVISAALLRKQGRADTTSDALLATAIRAIIKQEMQ